MRSWRLRSPAARLKQKILYAQAKTLRPANAWIWGCLAPGMACVLLTLLATGHSGASLGSKPVMEMVLSNQSYVSYAPEGSQTVQNHLAAVTFDSTNRSGIQSINGFTPTTNFSN